MRISRKKRRKERTTNAAELQSRAFGGNAAKQGETSKIYYNIGKASEQKLGGSISKRYKGKNLVKGGGGGGGDGCQNTIVEHRKGRIVISQYKGEWEGEEETRRVLSF